MNDIGEILSGKTLGDFRIFKVVGRGGMGVVFEAEQISRQRRIALKIPQDEIVSDAAFLKRFYDEANIAVRLRHRNVVSTYKVGECEGRHFIAMEFIDGRPLSMLIKKSQKLPVATSLNYARQIAAGLVAIHDEGIIHRDIKPKNVMIEAATDIAKIMDFGIAKLRRRDMEETDGAADLAGSKNYLSPEQIIGKRADQRTDIYAAGVALFEMLTGQVPYFDENPTRMMQRIIEEPVPEILNIIPSVPPDVQSILDLSLAKEADDRYANAGEMFDDLSQLVPKTGSSPRLV